MTILDAATKIQKSKENECFVDLEAFGEIFNLQFKCVEQDRIKGYWLANWYSTDSIVGYRIYFFDDKPVAFSEQIGRKYSEEIQWFSHKAAKSVKQYLLSLSVDKAICMCDMNKEIGESYSLEFNDEMLQSHIAVIRGKPVLSVEKINNDTSGFGLHNILKIKYNDDTEKFVHISDLKFSYYMEAEKDA